jgi:hypothetical protein
MTCRPFWNSDIKHDHSFVRTFKFHEELTWGNWQSADKSKTSYWPYNLYTSTPNTLLCAESKSGLKPVLRTEQYNISHGETSGFPFSISGLSGQPSEILLPCESWFDSLPTDHPYSGSQSSLL